MSIKSFFKAVNPLPKSEGGEERPLKKQKVTTELPSNVSATDDGNADPQSPGTIMSSKETPKKGEENATEGTSNSTASNGLTAEQLEKIEQRRQAAKARQQLMEKSKVSITLCLYPWYALSGG